MARPVTYRIVDCADGRFAVVAIAASGARYRRGGLLTLAEAEACVEELRVALASCGGLLAREDDGDDPHHDPGAPDPRR
jgi:hypothetical protein